LGASGSTSSAEAAYAADLHPFEVLRPLRQALDALRGQPVYVTVDIDVADPAFAPGTGTPEPGGIDARELLAAIAAMRELTIVAADVVEVAPAYDPGGITAALAAKIVRELILTVGAP
jgi:agmatinase